MMINLRWPTPSFLFSTSRWSSLLGQGRCSPIYVARGTSIMKSERTRSWCEKQGEKMMTNHKSEKERHCRQWWWRRRRQMTASPKSSFFFLPSSPSLFSYAEHRWELRLVARFSHWGKTLWHKKLKCAASLPKVSSTDTTCRWLLFFFQILQ
jgi:hypothetical protein